MASRNRKPRDVDTSNVPATEQTSVFTFLPNNLILAEMEGLYGGQVLAEMSKLIKYYEVYDKGAKWAPDNPEDYIPAQMPYKIARSLIDKQARFLFSKVPDYYVNVTLEGDSREQKQKAKDISTMYQDAWNKVKEATNFDYNLLKGAKDSFIAKRVAIMLNFNDAGVGITFSPALEFVYEIDPATGELVKICCFYRQLCDEKVTPKSQQKVYKKKYWMPKDEDGSYKEFCHVAEAMYDGNGNLIEEIVEEQPTLFSYVPAYVVLNGGLTGDIDGESEIDLLDDYEAMYSRLANADTDAERKSMNPVKYAIDMTPESTKGLSQSAGSFWDLSTSADTTDSGGRGQVGVLETNLSYQDTLDKNLSRIKGQMYEQVSVPDVSPDALKGVVSSGKTLKAIYWDLIVRCEEKMLAWRPALKFVMKCVFDGFRLYPNAEKVYLTESLPDDVEYTLDVENQYPLPEDEMEEKTSDMQQVNTQVMSKKTFMKKWGGMTNEEADDELIQIAKERQLLEDQAFPQDWSDIDEKNLEQNAEIIIDEGTTKKDSGAEGISEPEPDTEL